MTYSFCFSIPYGLIVSIGGLIGYLKKGSVMSLIMGLLFGGASIALGYSALQKYNRNLSDSKEILGGLALALILSIVMTKRWMGSSKFMPAGLVATLSIAMVLFYAYRYQFPLPLKKSKN